MCLFVYSFLFICIFFTYIYVLFLKINFTKRGSDWFYSFVHSFARSFVFMLFIHWLCFVFLKINFTKTGCGRFYSSGFFQVIYSLIFICFYSFLFYSLIFMLPFFIFFVYFYCINPFAYFFCSTAYSYSSIHSCLIY